MVLVACSGRTRRTSCIAKKVIAVNGSPSSRLPKAKPASVGLTRLAATPTACIA